MLVTESVMKDVTNCPICPNSATDQYKRIARCKIIGQVDLK